MRTDDHDQPSRALLRLAAAAVMVIAVASPLAGHAAPSGTAQGAPPGFYDSHGRISTFDQAGMGYVRDRAGRTHAIHLTGGNNPGLQYLTRQHGGAQGRSGWTRRLVPGTAKLVHRGDSVGLVLSPSGDRLYLAVQTRRRLYVVSKRPGAPNFPAITLPT
jgi:hypothetical protein